MGNVHPLKFPNMPSRSSGGKGGLARGSSRSKSSRKVPEGASADVIRVSAAPAQVEGPIPPFPELSQSLRERLRVAESQIDTILGSLDHEFDALAESPQWEKSQGLKGEAEVSTTLEHLKNDLKHRVKDKLRQLSQHSYFVGLEQEGADVAAKLTAELSQLLNLDVCRDIVSRLAEADAMDDYDEFGLDRALLEKIKPFFDFLYYKYWRVEVRGIENIPAEGAALIVANHSGTLPYDGAMIKAAILNEHPVRDDARFLVEDFVYHFPFLGTFMYRIGGVRASQENAERLLTKGHLVVVFPEGVKGIGKLFKERYHLQRFGRGGFVKLALRTGTPIIPVAVIGAEEIHPLIYKSSILAKPLGIPYVPFTPTLPLLGPLGLLPLPSKWTIHFGKPIYLREVDIEARDEDLFIHQTSEHVRTIIQEMVDEGLKQRKSVWRG